MSGLNPTGSSQPSLNQVYETQGNAATKEPAEQAQASANSRSTDAAAERVPQQQSSIDEATPTSMARGIRGAPAGEEAKGLTEEDVGRNQELEAQQMAAPGEGKIASAVDDKPGATGAQMGLESDLDRKKAEQAPLREAKLEEKKHDVDVGGVLGQRGGPANPVD